MKREHVTEIRAGINQGLTAEIGPKTLILGANGSGKSTLTMAMELALAGGASDVTGLPWADKDEALRHHLAPAGVSTAWAEVTTSEGRTYSWRKAPTTSADSVHAPPGALILPALSGINGWSNTDLRKWVATHAAGSVSVKQIAAAWEEVPTRLHAVVVDAMGEAGVEVDEDDGGDGGKLTSRSDFAAIQAALEAYRRARLADVRVAKKALDTLGSTALSPDPSDLAALDARIEDALAQIVAIDAQIVAAQVAATDDASPSDGQGTGAVDPATYQRAQQVVRNSKSRAATLTADVQAAKAKVNAAVDDAARLRAAAKKAAEDVEAASAAGDPQREKFRALHEYVIRANRDAEACVLCGTQHPPGALARHFDRIGAELQQVLAQMPDPLEGLRSAAAAADAEARTAEAVEHEYRAVYADAVRRYSAAEAEYKQANDVLARAEEHGVQDSGTSTASSTAHAVQHVSKLHAQRAEVADALSGMQRERDRLRTALDASERVARLRGERDAAEKDANDAKDALGKVRVAAQVASRAGVRDLEDRISRYLPGDTLFRVLVDGDRVRVGLQFGGEPDSDDIRVVTNPSASQEAAMLAAIASALAGPDGLAVAILPDRQWDPVHLKAVMKALAKADVQVIVQSTVKPKGRIPGVWTVVDLDAGKGADGLAVRVMDDDADEDDGGDGGDGGDVSPEAYQEWTDSPEGRAAEAAPTTEPPAAGNPFAGADPFNASGGEVVTNPLHASPSSTHPPRKHSPFGAAPANGGGSPFAVTPGKTT